MSEPTEQDRHNLWAAGWASTHPHDKDTDFILLRTRSYDPEGADLYARYLQSMTDLGEHCRAKSKRDP